MMERIIDAVIAWGWIALAIFGVILVLAVLVISVTAVIIFRQHRSMRNHGKTMRKSGRREANRL
ncbi:MAG: hypothetical protein PHS57_05930 [Alphaproteobacteria bacterium]|nr:hypothetical protein [Alphaproteobacteria bacterium]